MGGKVAEREHNGSMILAAAVDPEGSVAHSWGRAPAVAVARVEDGQILGWAEHPVGWDALHDEGTHGSHHARVVTFLRDNEVEVVLVDHVGDGMRRMLPSMGVRLIEGIQGDARQAMLAAASS